MKQKIETLTASKMLGEDTWDITLFKHTERGRNDLIAPHKHDFYLLLFVESGSGIHDIDFNTHRVEDFQIHFLRPDQVHYWNMSEKTKGFQLLFSKIMLNSFQLLSPLPFFYVGMPCVLNLNQKQYKDLKVKLLALEKQLKLTNRLDREIALLEFHTLLKHIHKLYQEAFELTSLGKVDNKILEFEALLEQYYSCQSQVSFYADKLKITSNYLNIKCKKILGVTASELIQNRIILEAKRLLTTTNASIKEIAFNLSFNDTPYFNNFFRKHTQLTPGEFRKSYNIYNKPK
ncbi:MULTISPECIES: AraC family transcriptional regulator [Myroides]|uniref:Helix-turn-helix domain-containing protein n=1 Tax=Myroides albus TaxID=2562892 RepID=A0A6I3LRM3_9FLAO|nr:MULTISPECIES: helix-turn-helix domain-containing protein [Myroides]MTG98625.1 helix-turn-helix domain-containing protein [Myroides albus]MVX34833.1 helix-turn-helix domain-containing protein [Myroides sp. LoEW2-1]UVD79188.1 AraC family transcriptional regulator [Myroides albus]